MLYPMVLLLYAFSAFLLTYKYVGVEKILHKQLWISHIPEVIPFILIYFTAVPLTFFYIIVYAMGCVPLFWDHSRKSRRWLFINMRFLFLTSLHLITLGVMALLLHKDVKGIFALAECRVYSLAFVILINAALIFLLQYSLRKEFMDFMKEDSDTIRLFSGFIVFCCFFTLLDSVPCLFELPAKFGLLFLIGSNIILLLLVILMVNRTYVLIKNAYLKNENLILKEEEAAQRSRTQMLEMTAYMDALTGAYTRRYGIDNITSMLAVGEQFVLVFIDLDGLKQINDQQGHVAGDDYLRRFSVLLKSVLRPNDIFVRYGGDEFLLLMPDVTLCLAEERLENIREKAGRNLPDGWGIPFSYGLIEVVSNDALGAEAWIAAADQRMYEDKKRHRDSREEIR